MPQVFNIALGTVLRSYADGAASVVIAVDADPPRLADALAALDAAFPGIRFRMMDEAGRVRPHIKVFVNNTMERDPGAVLPDGAQLMLVGALSGG